MQYNHGTPFCHWNNEVVIEMYDLACLWREIPVEDFGTKTKELWQKITKEE